MQQYSIACILHLLPYNACIVFTVSCVPLCRTCRLIYAAVQMSTSQSRVYYSGFWQARPDEEMHQADYADEMQLKTSKISTLCDGYQVLVGMCAALSMNKYWIDCTSAIYLVGKAGTALRSEHTQEYVCWKHKLLLCSVIILRGKLICKIWL